jgi:hypothetical protein
MNDWYQRMIAALQLNGKGKPTQKAYTRAVRMLSEFYGKTPDLISEPELQEYFLHRKNVNRWAPPAAVWTIDWNVNCQAVGSSQASVKYLAPYVFKVAISNSRIIGLYDRSVLIRYRKPHSERSRTLALDAMEFIRRFLQHVLPTGFMKIRYYGFMNPNCAVPLQRIRGLIELSYGFALDLPLPEVETPRRSTCPSCGGLLKFRSVLPPLKILRRSG